MTKAKGHIKKFEEISDPAKLMDQRGLFVIEVGGTAITVPLNCNWAVALLKAGQEVAHRDGWVLARRVS